MRYVFGHEAWVVTNASPNANLAIGKKGIEMAKVKPDANRMRSSKISRGFNSMTW